MNLNDAILIFGLSKSYSIQDLKNKYKCLCMEYHPDRLNPMYSVSELQERMSQINCAYRILKNSLPNQNSYNTEEQSDDKAHASFSFDNEEFTRPKVHPDHINESYKFLWWEIRELRKNRHGLALKLYQLAIDQLLKDHEHFPDLGPIIHNYIRDYSSLLSNLGYYKAAIKISLLACELNVGSYYTDKPPSDLIYKLVCRSVKSGAAINTWRQQLIGKFLFSDINLHWAMLAAEYISGNICRLIKDIEDGLVFSESFAKSMLEREPTQKMIDLFYKRQDNAITIKNSNPLYPRHINFTGQINTLELVDRKTGIRSMILHGLKELGITRLCYNSSQFNQCKRILGKDFDWKTENSKLNYRLGKIREQTNSFGLGIVENINWGYSSEELNAIWGRCFSRKPTIN